MQIGKFCKKHGRPFVTGVLCAIVGYIALNVVVEHTSAPDFCGGTCHEMNTAYETWELSEHGTNRHGVSVGCVDCHLPPKEKFFAHLAAKSYEGLKDTGKHLLGGDYDLEVMRKKVVDKFPSQRCLRCHNALLSKKSSDQAARDAHLAALSRPEEPQHRCVVCHENVGHERHSKLFSP